MEMVTLSSMILIKICWGYWKTLESESPETAAGVAGIFFAIL